jgi:hypothetical protein
MGSIQARPPPPPPPRPRDREMAMKMMKISGTMAPMGLP